MPSMAVSCHTFEEPVPSKQEPEAAYNNHPYHQARMSHLQAVDIPCFYILADSQPGRGNIYLADIYLADAFLADIVLRAPLLCLLENVLAKVEMLGIVRQFRSRSLVFRMPLEVEKHSTQKSNQVSTRMPDQ